MAHAPSDRTRIHRHPERGDHDPAMIRAVLDDALLCTVSWVDEEGAPRGLPTIQARIDDTLYLHGSRGARAWKAVAGGAEVCVVATVVDELVLARTSPAHSMNYRSVVVYGVAREVVDPDEMDHAQRSLVEHVVPGRTADVRMPSDKELKETTILALGLDEASAKVRTGPPKDPEEDLALSAWAGVLPLRFETGDPVDSPDLRPGIRPPGYVTGYRRPGGSGVTV